MNILKSTLLAATFALALNAADKPGDAGSRAETQDRPGRRAADGPAGQPMNEKDREAVRKHMQAMNEESRTHREKQRSAQNALREAVFADKIDEAGIRAKAAELGKVEGELAVIRARHMAKLKAELSPDAFDRLKNSPMGMGGGAGGMRRGRGADGAPGGPEGDRPRGRRDQP